MISATASAGVMEGYCLCRINLFSLERSTHIRILSEFFGVTMIGVHHSVGVWLLSSVVSFFNLSLYAKGIMRGVAQKGQAFSESEMWNFSPGMLQICPSNTDGNLGMIASADNDSDSSRFIGCSSIGDVVRFG